MQTPLVQPAPRHLEATQGDTWPPQDSNAREELQVGVDNTTSSSQILLVLACFHSTSPTKPRLPSRVTFCPLHFLLLASSWFGISHYGLTLQQPNSPIIARGARAVMIAGYLVASLPKFSCKTSYLRQSCVSHPRGFS